jgi:hypothetical protein
VPTTYADHESTITAPHARPGYLANDADATASAAVDTAADGRAFLDDAVHARLVEVAGCRKAVTSPGSTAGGLHLLT